jgi:hypothetical protein
MLFRRIEHEWAIGEQLTGDAQGRAPTSPASGGLIRRGTGALLRGQRHGAGDDQENNNASHVAL